MHLLPGYTALLFLSIALGAFLAEMMADQSCTIIIACAATASIIGCALYCTALSSVAQTMHGWGWCACLVLQVTRGYQAVLMDFGSARPMPVHVSSRAQALAVQEDAEVRQYSDDLFCWSQTGTLESSMGRRVCVLPWSVCSECSQ